MTTTEMLLIVATYPNAEAAEAGQARLAESGISAHILPKVPGWLGRAFGRTKRYHLGVDATELAQAKAVLQQAS